MQGGRRLSGCARSAMTDWSSLPQRFSRCDARHDAVGPLPLLVVTRHESGAVPTGDGGVDSVGAPQAMHGGQACRGIGRGGVQRDDGDMLETGDRTSVPERPRLVVRRPCEGGSDLYQKQRRNDDRIGARLHGREQLEALRVTDLERVESVDEHTGVDGVARRGGRLGPSASTGGQSRARQSRASHAYLRDVESWRTPLWRGRNRPCSRRPAFKNSSQPSAASDSRVATARDEPSTGRMTPIGRPRCVSTYVVFVSRTRRRMRAACVLSSRTPTLFRPSREALSMWSRMRLL